MEVGANGKIGVGTLVVREQTSSKSRNPTLVKLRNLQSRQIRQGKIVVAGRLVVTHACKSCIRNGRDAEIARTDRGVLVTASIFEMMLGPKETIGPEEPRAIGSHSLGTIVEASGLERVEDIGVLGTHRSVA
jgi:hypothetical protein